MYDNTSSRTLDDFCVDKTTNLIYSSNRRIASETGSSRAFSARAQWPPAIARWVTSTRDARARAAAAELSDHSAGLTLNHERGKTGKIAMITLSLCGNNALWLESSWEASKGRSVADVSYEFWNKSWVCSVWVALQVRFRKLVCKYKLLNCPVCSLLQNNNSYTVQVMQRPVLI